MGKRIEDLRKLDDAPIVARQVEALDGDERSQPWYAFVAEIDQLLNSDDYGWAIEALNGIRETVEHSRRVSEGQRRAVANIEARGRERFAKRRYEGWRGTPR